MVPNSLKFGNIITEATTISIISLIAIIISPASGEMKKPIYRNSPKIRFA